MRNQNDFAVGNGVPPDPQNPQANCNEANCGRDCVNSDSDLDFISISDGFTEITPQLLAGGNDINAPLREVNFVS